MLVLQERPSEYWDWLPSLVSYELSLATDAQSRMSEMPWIAKIHEC